MSIPAKVSNPGVGVNPKVDPPTILVGTATKKKIIYSKTGFYIYIIIV